MHMVITLIKGSNIDASKICFENTKAAAISSFSKVIKFITDLKGIACQFALDDFGSGLSSFKYLKNLPIDYLKIDGMFVKGMFEDPLDNTIVKSINDIGMKTFAEFVENDVIKEQLKRPVIDSVQGYGIGNPPPFN